MSVAIVKCICKTCGREFTVKAKRANRAEADNFKEWAERTVDECPDCGKKRFQQEIDEANAEAAKSAESMGLPELKGSPKQIAWATTIRQDAMERVLQDIDDKADTSSEEGQNAKALCTGFLFYLARTKTQAAWWIDNRFTMEPDMCTIKHFLTAFKAEKKAFMEGVGQDEKN